MKTLATLTAAMLVTAGPAGAQTTSTQSQPSARDRVGQILGTLFGDRLGVSTSIEAQWAAGRTPLAQQRTQFESRIDADVRAGALSAATGARVKADYRALVELEARYGADGRFTTQERTDLADRYGALTQVLAEGGYQDAGSDWTSISDGRSAFDARVDAAVRDRRLARTEGTRLKADYAALVRLETSYLLDGTLSERERGDLEARLDALDVRVGDAGFGSLPSLTSRERLNAIARALPSSGLTAAAQAQLRVEHGDLLRLEAAYSRLNITADERAYFERRLVDLEARARVRR